jgi:hypothetical protein
MLPTHTTEQVMKLLCYEAQDLDTSVLALLTLNAVAPHVRDCPTFQLLFACPSHRS